MSGPGAWPWPAAPPGWSLTVQSLPRIQLPNTPGDVARKPGTASAARWHGSGRGGTQGWGGRRCFANRPEASKPDADSRGWPHPTPPPLACPGACARQGTCCPTPPGSTPPSVGLWPGRVAPGAMEPRDVPCKTPEKKTRAPEDGSPGPRPEVVAADLCLPGRRTCAYG